MDQPGSDDLIVIARAVRTHGLKGHVVAELLTDFPERFEDVHQLVVVCQSGERKAGRLEDYWFQKNRVVLKLADYDDIEKAKELIGSDFAVQESERVSLQPDEYYDWELEGCTVKVENESIGEVRSVMRTGGAEILVISDPSGKEQLVPLATPIIVEVNVAAKIIVIDPPEGLLEL